MIQTLLFLTPKPMADYNTRHHVQTMNSVEMIVVDHWYVGCRGIPSRCPPLGLKDSCVQMLRLLVTVSSPATSCPPWKGDSYAKVAGSAHIQWLFGMLAACGVPLKGHPNSRAPQWAQLGSLLWIMAQPLPLLSSSTFTPCRCVSPKHFLVNFWTCKFLPVCSQET